MGALDDLTETGEANSKEGEGESGSAENETGSGRMENSGSWKHRVVACVVILATLAIVLPPLFAWQSENQQKALSLSNMRRVATGCLIYMQDWDERMPPPVQRAPDGFAVSWPRLVRPYVLLDEAFSNPSNPVKPFSDLPHLTDPTDRHPIDTSYALNHRFWGVFGQGPFPVGNLEIPEQTALLVEAGRMAAEPRQPRFANSRSAGLAVDLYTDTTDRVGVMSPFPSTHGGQIGMVAADGHGLAARVLFYGSNDGPHDRKLGRIGDGIYNWNGGHPNGETDRPSHE